MFIRAYRLQLHTCPPSSVFSLRLLHIRIWILVGAFVSLVFVVIGGGVIDGVESSDHEEVSTVSDIEQTLQK